MGNIYSRYFFYYAAFGYPHNNYKCGTPEIFLKILQVHHNAQYYITANSLVYNLHQAQHINSGRLPLAMIATITNLPGLASIFIRIQNITEQVIWQNGFRS